MTNSTRRQASKKLKVALVYDHLNTRYGGAEQVLRQLHQIYPHAPLFTSVYHEQQASWAKKFTVVPTFLQQVPFAKTHHRWLAAIAPIAFESLDVSDFDIIISVSGGQAKGVITKPHQLHVSYLLTPTRYLYSHQSAYLETLPIYLRWIAQPVIKYLTRWDRLAVNRPDFIIPISKVVGARIKRYFPDLRVKVTPPIYPPISIPDQSKSTQEEGESPLKEVDLLCYGRLVEYKRFDRAIEAAQQLGRKLTIAGEGPALSKLKQKASQATQPTLIQFLPHLPQPDLWSITTPASVILFPGEEDFGISQVEVALAGKPVVLHKQSGAAELVRSLNHVVTIDQVTPESLSSAIMKVEQQPIDTSQAKKLLIKYDDLAFQTHFKKTITKLWLATHRMEDIHVT